MTATHVPPDLGVRTATRTVEGVTIDAWLDQFGLE
jgi:hypothetical protein